MEVHDIFCQKNIFNLKVHFSISKTNFLSQNIKLLTFKKETWHFFNAPKTGVGMKIKFGNIIFLVKENKSFHLPYVPTHYGRGGHVKSIQPPDYNFFKSTYMHPKLDILQPLQTEEKQGHTYNVNNYVYLRGNNYIRYFICQNTVLGSFKKRHIIFKN